MDIKLLQGVMYFGLIVFLTFVLYGYIFHLYRSEKRGERDYEKYGKIALDDELTSKPIEPIEEETKKESK
ncbi:MAG: cytochrome c oxidase, cbb3-type, CcoQ subunit [Epsilonproteobacteria bacterium]|nr:cytochrome c oxidase, cbb3-type, CcoQ subunit [Campylobacterota bacterium]NPA57219.1 cytochrome c oxidase, cbb3-type, CcoQ subunit [Campylobacterota bacterium]